MQISISELKQNAGKYVKLADEQDIYITRNGKQVAKITTAKPDKLAAAKALIGLFGTLPDDIDLDKERTERING